MPSTTRHTVSGVAMSRPSGPQSHVQNATRHQQRNLRDPGRPGIQHGLEHEIREQLEADEQADHLKRTGPALESRKADQDRRARTEHRPDVRDESERRRQRRPDQCVRHAEEVEPDAPAAMP